MDNYPEALTDLIKQYQKLPGVGRRTAMRFAFHTLDSDPSRAKEFAAALSKIHERIIPCRTCGFLTEGNECPLCSDPRRDQTKLCVVAHAKEIFAIEESGEWRGLYHALGGLLSPLDGIAEDALRIPQLKQRLEKGNFEEVVIAIDSTLEGDTTSLFLKEELSSFSAAIHRLAFGIPMGSSLEHVDGGTLAHAFSGRKLF